MLQRHLVIMAKFPQIGMVKTRLAADIGAVQAIRFYRHNLKVLVGRLSNEKCWETISCVAPDRNVKLFANIYSGKVMAQGRGDLGQRIQTVFNVLPKGPVLIIGSDIPQITQSDIADAFQALGRSDMVIGNGMDGGYWLIGMKRTPNIKQGIFKNVAWSSKSTFADTMRNLEGLRVEVLPALNDIDDGADFSQWKQQGGRY